jgi:hypothetical protein
MSVGTSNNGLNFIINSNGSPEIASAAAVAPIHFSQGSTRVMTLSDNGNVGIGTNNPSYKLDIWNGSDFDMRLRDNSLGGTVGILFETSNNFSGTSQAYIKGVGQGASGRSDLIFGTATNAGDVTASEKMRITSGGNVGIGTTSPNARLQVQDSANTFPLLISGLNQTNGIAIGTNSSNVAVIQGYTRTFSATNNIAINADGGNVGIGTTSPNARLEIRESNRVFDSYGNINVFTTDLSTQNVGGSIALGGDSFGGTSPYPFAKIQGIKEGGGAWAGALILGTTQSNSAITEKMRITSAGNVGIGTTSPSYTLHVNGSVAGTSAYVNLSDKRYKKDILPIENALDKILALNGVTFNWDKENTDMNLDDNNHIGLLAQDVEEIIPQVVSTGTDENKTKSVAYTDLIPVLIEAIKELKAEIEILKNK